MRVVSIHGGDVLARAHAGLLLEIGRFALIHVGTVLLGAEKECFVLAAGGLGRGWNPGDISMVLRLHRRGDASVVIQCFVVAGGSWLL